MYGAYLFLTSTQGNAAIQIAQVRVLFRKTMCNIYDLIFIILIVTIFEGRTMTRFQEHFPGFITYKESEAVKVLSIENINGIDFWEAVVSHWQIEI